MKATVQVDYSVSNEIFKKIEKFVERENLSNSNLNSFDVKVSRSEYTCIDSEDENNCDLISLFYSVTSIIDEDYPE